jgi:hypothetical protein
VQGSKFIDTGGGFLLEEKVGEDQDDEPVWTSSNRVATAWRCTVHLNSNLLSHSAPHFYKHSGDSNGGVTIAFAGEEMLLCNSGIHKHHSFMGKLMDISSKYKNIFIISTVWDMSYISGALMQFHKNECCDPILATNMIWMSAVIPYWQPIWFEWVLWSHIGNQYDFPTHRHHLSGTSQY